MPLVTFLNTGLGTDRTVGINQGDQSTWTALLQLADKRGGYEHVAVTDAWY